MNLSDFAKRFLVAAGVAGFLSIGASRAVAQPYQATGFKVGEGTDTTAIVWARLTRHESPNSKDAPMVEVIREGRKVVGVRYPEGVTVADIRNATPGAPGEVRVLYRAQSEAEWRETDWQAVDPKRDFTRQFTLTDLEPRSEYTVQVESRKDKDGAPGQTLEGHFRTAPSADDSKRVIFTVSTGQSFGDQDRPDGYKIYPQMLKIDPDFFVHTGDIVYYDGLAKNEALARYHWQRTYSRPTNVAFHNQVMSYFIKDDHDTWQNDSWPTMKNDKMLDFTWEQGIAIFPEQVPMGERTYRTRRWGKDLQIWMPEGRDFRSANTDPDGPGKTIWGAEQMAWFKKSVQESDATFRLLISPTPIVGPDRENKNDNHANKGFAHEGNALRRYLADQKNMVVLCGDRHWQYVSIDPHTGLREYSCGPASNEHAAGWSNDQFYPDYHQYLNVIGGFLAVKVERKNGQPTLMFRHYGVEGKVLNEDLLTLKDGALVEM